MHSDEALDRIDTALKKFLEQSREEAQQQAGIKRNLAAEQEASRRGESQEPDRVNDTSREESEAEQKELYASQEMLSSPTDVIDLEQEDAIRDEHGCDAALFFESSYTPRLARLIDRIIAEHGPISEILLYRTIARLHGWQRAGRRIQERIMNCTGDKECREENGTVFIWQTGSYCDKLPFRAKPNRSPRDVPQAEILGLIDDKPHVLRSSDPAKEIATLMGLGRLSSDTRSYLETCIKELRRLQDESEA
jgi:Protein of unknown function (DUF3320)